MTGGSARPWSRASAAQYCGLPLRAHELLHDVPLHDVWCVALPDRDRSRSMLDVRATVERAGRSGRLGTPVRALFRIRWAVGRLLRWDRRSEGPDPASYLSRLSIDDRRRSLVAPGASDGHFTVLFVHQHEAISEIRNATVHGFVVWALEPAPDGYRLLLAVHVLPVGRWTRPYMALIDPFRRWLVYPALLRRLHEEWTATEAVGNGRIAL